MSRIKFMSAEEAVALIPDGATIGSVGFLMAGVAEEIWLEIGKRFDREEHPKDIGVVWASGIGDGETRGMNHICKEGLLTRAVGGHYGLIKKMAPLLNGNKMTAYNLPQGVISQMFREMAGGRPGVVSHVGLGTFVDPDHGGGKVNSVTTKDIVQKIHLNGKPYLFYEAQKFDIAIIRGTEADENGNVSMRNEILTLENLSCAMAARNNGGMVIVQVEKIVKNGTISPKDVKVPGILVDVVVQVKDPKNHMQTGNTQYNENFLRNGVKIQVTQQEPMKLDIKKAVARRCAMQAKPTQRIMNFGIGYPEAVATVMKEEGIEEFFSPSVEPGLIGGSAQGGLDFGAAINPEAIIDEPYQFDFYDGGGVDCTFLGMAECDGDGNLNVSKFGPRIPGCGGFIDISQNSKECVFCGTFTADGLKVEIKDGKVSILQEGAVKKFITKVEQITFNGKLESLKNKKITLVTERAVFELTPEGPVLTEIAPGINLEKDILGQMEFSPIISKELKEMDVRIFKDAPLGLRENFTK